MDIQHLNVKIFVDDLGSVKLEDFIVIFNDWIQKRATDDLLIDVADYCHVPAGPGVLLIGHEANYSLDNTGNRLGLLYNRKAQLPGTTLEKLARAFRAALTAARRLEKEQRLKFSGQEAQVIINDRLLAPNTPETFAALESELKAFFNRLYGGAEYTLTQPADLRERFTVNVKTAANFDLETLLKILAAEVESVHA